jgi:thymidine phosphorylase
MKDKKIDLKLINNTARTLGSPIDELAWLYLHKKVGDKVKENEIIYTMYASEKNKINMAIEWLKGEKMYEIN